MPKEIERRYENLTEFRVDEEEGTIEGYAAVFNRWADLGWFKEKIEPGAFKRTIKQNDIRALKNHDPNLIIGRTKNKTLKLWEDDKGLAYSVKLDDTSYAQDLAKNIRRKDITGNSFGFSIPKDGDEWDEKMTKRTIKEAVLFDVGPVTFPAYPQTTVSIRSMQGDDEIDYVELALAIIKQQRGIELNDKENELIHTAMDIINNFRSVEDPAARRSDESDAGESPSQDQPTNGHSEDQSGAAKALLIREKLLMMEIRKLTEVI